MFVGCVVAGRIVTLNGGVKARGAQIRDVCSYLIAVAVVTGAWGGMGRRGVWRGGGEGEEGEKGRGRVTVVRGEEGGILLCIESVSQLGL
jgi:hypothetical protein